MSAFVHDQAEGLRRLLNPDFVRIVAVASALPGIGKSTVLANLAAMLARRGRRVLVASQQLREPLPELAPPPRAGLDAVLRGQKALIDVLAEGKSGVRWLRLDDLTALFTELDAARQQALTEAFQQVGEDVDVVLLDVLPGDAPLNLALTLAAQEILLVMSPGARTITATYAHIKRLAKDFALRRFHLAVNRAGSGGEALAIYNNLAETAGRYLGVRPLYAGSVLYAERIRQANRLGRSVVEAFPDGPEAAAFGELAQTIEAWPRPDAAEGRLDAFFNKLVMTIRLAAENAHF